MAKIYIDKVLKKIGLHLRPDQLVDVVQSQNEAIEEFLLNLKGALDHKLAEGGHLDDSGVKGHSIEKPKQNKPKRAQSILP